MRPVVESHVNIGPAEPGYILAKAAWPALYAQLRSELPEAFHSDRRVSNLIGGRWQRSPQDRSFHSACDGTQLCWFSPLRLAAVHEAVRFAAGEHESWSQTPLAERCRRVAACMDRMRSRRELLANLLVWEIGKPYKQSLTSVDRCIAGVEWYIEEIGSMLSGRDSLGLISNIASWNYPLSVLMHSVLVQVLAGNPVIAKTPSDGGLCALTLCFGYARQAGLPVSLVSGSGGELAPALVEGEAVECLAFVGGKTNGRDIATLLESGGKRYMLEMEGINAWGIWEFSDWEALGSQIRKGFEYGKQRCTAYPRYVIQRNLFPQFLSMYLPILATLRVGHPMLVHGDETEPPVLDFGPLINAAAASELNTMIQEALDKGAIPLHAGALDASLLLPGQDRSAYVAPSAFMNVPQNCALHHREPFGP
ncbi:MAG: aldehyde dehydrogenase family protein, partial [Chloroflexota bacterium]